MEQRFDVSDLSDVDWSHDVDFLYVGNDISGEVIVSKPGGPRLEVRVICEDDEWKIDDTFDDDAEQKRDNNGD